MWRWFYVMFRAVSGAGFWIERRFTRAGLLVLGGLVVAAVFGIDTSLTVAYRIFTLCAAVLALAVIVSWFGKSTLAVRVQLPHTLTAGEPFTLRLDVRNDARKPVDGASLRAELDDPRPSFREFHARLRFPTYRGWARLLWSNRMAYVEEALVPLLEPRAQTALEIHGRALKRGRLRIGGIEVARADPLGLFRSLTPVAGPADICVLPKRYALPSLSLPGARRYQPGGLPQGASVGDSEEFLGLRDYRPGDPLQRIHWRSFARVGKPVVKEYQDEFVARYALVLDTFAPDDADERAGIAFEEAVAVAASFAWTIDTQECLLDLMFVGAEIHLYTAGRGQLLPGRLLEVLAGVSMTTERNFAALVELVRTRREQLSACVCILLTWDDARKALVDALRASGAMVLPLVVSAQPPDDLPAGVKLLAPGKVAEALVTL
jgi:uncharacterized protein (DUF58 family)